jgi:hypothetical protein
MRLPEPGEDASYVMDFNPDRIEQSIREYQEFLAQHSHLLQAKTEIVGKS